MIDSLNKRLFIKTDQYEGQNMEADKISIENKVNNQNKNNQNTLICIQIQQSRPYFESEELGMIKNKVNQILPKIIENSYNQNQSKTQLQNQKYQQDKLLQQYKNSFINQDAVLLNLTNKIQILEQQYFNLLEKQQNITFIKSGNSQQLHSKKNLILQNLNQSLQSKVLAASSNNNDNISHQLNLSKAYQYQIFIPKKPKQSEVNKEVDQCIFKNTIKAPSQPLNQVIMKIEQQNIRQFSSGEVQNLLIQDDSFASITNKFQEQSQYHIHGNFAIKKPRLVQIDRQNILPSTFSCAKKHPLSYYQTTIPFILLSKYNLEIIKQSSQSLSYQKIVQTMTLQKLHQKISFKPKHYPSSLSTQKQIRLYGKRLFRLLKQISNSKVTLQNDIRKNEQHFISHSQQLQNQLQYEQNEQSTVFYAQGNKKFIVICYYNHTIYVGEYITQGPNHQQIIRQGFGIQYRQNKYLYQGQFFADKKHGYGFINHITRSSFIYFGYFLDGFIDGNGTQINDKRQIYMGQYKVGQKDGWGKLIYDKQKNSYYEGQFYDGHKHGKGHQIFQNGDSYTGNYIRDKFQGEGQYKWSNGTVYRGIFLQGLKNGRGMLIFKNGKTFQKSYENNKQINLENSDDKKTIKSSRVSSSSQIKIQEKTFIQQKTRKLRSHSRDSLFSNLSKSKQKKIKISKQKKKIMQILKQKQLQQDLQNLDNILKDPKQNSVQQGKKRTFSLKNISQRQKIMGKMYNTSQRPSLKLNQGQVDLFKLNKMGKRKSVINFSQNQKLQQFKQVKAFKRINIISNFSQF